MPHPHVGTKVSRVRLALPPPEVTALSLPLAPPHVLLPARAWLRAQEALREVKPLSKVVTLHSLSASDQVCVWWEGQFRPHNVRERFM